MISCVSPLGEANFRDFSDTPNPCDKFDRKEKTLMTWSELYNKYDVAIMEDFEDNLFVSRSD